MGDKVGYSIVKEGHTIKKRILPQNTVFSAEHSAIFGAIQSEKNSRNEIVIITDTLSTIMAAESRKPTKNPKTQTVRKMLELLFIWVPSHKRIPSNKKANQAVKEALDEDIPTSEKYPPDDLKKWLTEEDFKDGKMETRKPEVDRGFKRNAKERARGNIQTQNQIYEGHLQPQDGQQEKRYEKDN
jgi:hypothetical protein